MYYGNSLECIRGKLKPGWRLISSDGFLLVSLGLSKARRSQVWGNGCTMLGGKWVLGSDIGFEATVSHLLAM